jgi:uncharacterized MAPEG superfamily protein
LLGLSIEKENFPLKYRYIDQATIGGTKRTSGRVEVGLRHRVSVGHGRTEPPFRQSPTFSSSSSTKPPRSTSEILIGHFNLITPKAPVPTASSAANMPTNLSFFAVPVYWLLTMLPHTYAVLIARSANNGRWNNVSPRSSTWDETLRKSTPKEIYARYERGEAAHKNGMENLPLFVGAILAGNFAKLETRTLNLFVVLFLLIRILYTIFYVSISSHRLSYLRSSTWFMGAALCMGIFVKAGFALP